MDSDVAHPYRAANHLLYGFARNSFEGRPRRR